MKSYKILVLGASGMLGNAIYLYFSNETQHKVYGSIRSGDNIKFFPQDVRENLIVNVDVFDDIKIECLIDEIRPEILINCIGVVKQLGNANEPLTAIPINSLLPHKLAKISEKYSVRLIHLSTDCVFSGNAGMYTESDKPDARDLYGLSKLLGEVDSLSALTLRTSIIGHELNGNRSLLSWFLSQSGSVKGFNKAIFSGLPTTEISSIINKYIISNKNLHGIYNLSIEPIDKYSLLKIFKNVYNKDIQIESDDSLKIDRSLDSSKFKKISGYQPPNMETLIIQMRDLYLKWGVYV
jgi:dTDP-4-dehydrorhamnose reductase